LDHTNYGSYPQNTTMLAQMLQSLVLYFDDNKAY